MPDLLDPQQLQALLQGQDYHMMETEIEALLLKAKAEARLRERKRVREITELVRKEAQMKLKYHVALAQKQIRLDLNERVKATVQTHARMQKASLTPCDDGEGMTLLVKQQPEDTATFRKRLSKREVRSK